MKKNLATAMAAAMAFGAVVPAFAAEVETFALTDTTVDQRLASGLELYVKDGETPGVTASILTRAEVYDFNGAASDEYAKHTVKDKFKDMTIVYESADKTQYVLVKKSTDTAGVAAAKAQLDAINREIADYVRQGYTKSEAPVASTITGGSYVAGSNVVTLQKGNDASTRITITFQNIDKQATDTEVAKETALTTKLRKEVFGTGYLDGDNKKQLVHTDAVELSRVKYLVSKNVSKFDIVKEETNNNTDYNVRLYRKGAKKEAHNLVADITVTGFAGIDKDKIVNVPATNDFASHWASDQILNAMLAGDVDASAKFRPEDGITRAEFAKMVAEMMTAVDTTDTDVAYDEDKTYAETFHDVVKGDWFQNYVGYLQKAGVVQGDGEKFRPNDKITREEVAIMLTNALDKTKSDNAFMANLDADGVKKAHTAISKADLNALKFKDKKDINIWADHSVKYLSGKEYTTGKVIAGGDDKGYFNPTKNITRAEALVMVQRTASTTK